MSRHQNSAQSERALLHLFRNSLTGETRPLSENLNEEQWATLGRLAEAHGVVPWLILHLPPASINALPESLIAEWKAWEQQNRLRVLANWSVAIRVLGLMDSAGIRALPIKGVALSQQIYGAPWLRPAGDVDLLLGRRLIPTAHKVMLAEGFVPEYPGMEATSSEWGWVFKNGHHASYRDPKSRTLVELHWRMHGQPLLDFRDEKWIGGELKEIEVLGRKTLAPAAPVQYLLVMSHLARSHWSRLIWVLDSWLALKAARTIHSDAELNAIIAEHGAIRIHRQFLSLMQYVLEDDGLRQWPPPGFGTPHERMKSWGPARRGLDGLLSQMGLKGSIRYKMSVLRSYLLSPYDFALVPLPDWLFWLYAPLRIPLWVYRRYLRPLFAPRARP